MKNKSIWENVQPKKNDKKIENNLETDILIIGGGITGLTTAYFLKDSEKKVTLIDKSVLERGVTSKTTAKINYLQGTIYQELTNNFDMNIAKKYYNSQKEAISIIKEIVSNHNIKCDLEKVPSIIFTLEEENVKKIEKEEEILKKWDVSTEVVENSKIKAGFKVNDTYTFHPLKYLDGLKKALDKKVDIYEEVLAIQINNCNNYYEVETNKGKIKTKIVVVACHYPFFIYPSFIPLKTYVKREYVNVSKFDKKEKYTAINIDNALHSIRFYKDYIIYTSNQHRLTSKLDWKKNYDKSREDFKKYFGKSAEYTWMNQDIMSNDKLPFIGKVKDNLYIATAFNAWGMTNGTISGKIISDLIIKSYSPYQYLFKPDRGNMTLYFESFLGAFHYMKAYAQGLVQKNNPDYIKIKGLWYGVYTDEDGNKHTIKLLCPHMKCNLVFNNEEKTWDCPCHGSRFDLDGKLLEGPATKNIDEK